MEIQVYSINAFANSLDGGNPAGVVFDADYLNEDQMHRVAQKMGYSETAFVMKSEIADYKVRFFTPNDEVDLCGHATIGTFAAMSKLGMITEGKYSQETKAGKLSVRTDDCNKVMMQQPLPMFGDTLPSSEIAASLRLPPDALERDIPIQIVSTGLRDAIIPVRNLDILMKMQPDMDSIMQLSRKYGVVGYHVFTTECMHPENTAHCRNFAPLFGIPEEAATGTSNGALAGYLHRYVQRKDREMIRYAMEQGYCMNRPSEIYAELSCCSGQVHDLHVGGFAENLRISTLDI